MKLRRTVAGVTFAALILITISLLDAGSTRSIGTMIDHAAGHQKALLTLERLRSTTRDLVRSERGYVLAGRDPLFLETYTTAIQKLAVEQEQLRGLLRSRPDASTQLHRLERATAALMRTSNEAMSVGDHTSNPRIAAAFARAEREEMDAINSAVDALSRIEAASLRAHSDEIRDRSSLSMWIDMFGNAIVLAIAAFSFLVLRREMIARTQARNEATAANEQLRLRIEQIQRNSRDFALLSEMSEMMQLSTSEAEIGHVIRRYGARLFEEAAGSVYAVQPGTQLFELDAWWGERPSADAFHANDCWALRRGQTQHCHASLHTRTAGASQSTDGPSMICIPLLAHGTSLGVLSLQPRTMEISRSAQALARAFADQVALSLANVRLQESLLTRAVRDPLTGLFNRRYLEEALGRELRRADRHQHKVGVLVVDADHFKRINDEYGHAAGDLVLTRLAGVLREATREEDIACRFGGEEFVLVLAEIDEASLRARADQIRDAVRALNLRHQNQSMGKLTVSIGAAISGPHLRTVADLIAHADRALYQAKSAGRDRTVGPLMLSDLNAA
jgi:diguanylate cyclase (GGDEF)-like protein